MIRKPCQPQGFLLTASMRFFSFFITLLISGTVAAQTAKPLLTFSSMPGVADKTILKVTGTIPGGTIVYGNSNSEELPGITIEFDSSIGKKVTVGGVVQNGELTKKDAQLDNALVKYFEHNFSIEYTLALAEPVDFIKGKINYTAFDGKEFIGPEAVEFYLKKQADGTYSGGEFQLAAATGNELLIANLDLKKPIDNCGIAPDNDRGLLKTFILGLLGGLLALLTPCVFPMIPLTVSFFTKKSGDKSTGKKNAVLYGLFIFFIYVALSIPFHIFNLPKEFYNQVSTNVYLNIFFFIIFVVFAISFFGYFDITLPSSLGNRTDSKKSTSFIGIFFMALTLAIVSFSCTGPILGSLLASNAAGGEWALTAGLAGFGVALGLPFALFAMFPQWLSALPKSGGWMTTVKVVLGFIELALALKFLSNADLVAHLGILKREVFFGLWILIGLATFAYLMGWFSFKKEYVKPVIGKGRKITAFIFLAIAIYLMPGVTNTKYANIALVSGFPPPACYSIYSHPVNCNEPLHDYDAAVKLAKEKNMPILVDFTGYACVNCRKMEENVWTTSVVKEQMDKFILVSLYVDDKKELPADKQFLYKTKDSTDKKIVTVGDKWATFESENFEAVSQPFYVLLSPDGRLLVPPVGYTPNENEYAKWLACGYKAFTGIKKP
jgi:thiol:disulfide interchange protein